MGAVWGAVISAHRGPSALLLIAGRQQLLIQKSIINTLSSLLLKRLALQQLMLSVQVISGTNKPE